MQIKFTAYSYNFDHLTAFDSSISINIIHLIGPLQLFFWSSTRGDINGQKKFLKVNFAGVVFIECSEYVGTKFFRVSVWEESRVYFDELLFAELT